MTLVYKILGRADWELACAKGRYDGSDDDRRDQFIHFSAHDQVAETAMKYFAGARDHVVVAVPVDRLAPHLKWESSRGGALFPHLYSALDTACATHVVPLEWTAAGRVHWVDTDSADADAEGPSKTPTDVSQ